MIDENILMHEIVTLWNSGATRKEIAVKLETYVTKISILLRKARETGLTVKVKRKDNKLLIPKIVQILTQDRPSLAQNKTLALSTSKSVLSTTLIMPMPMPTTQNWVTLFYTHDNGCKYANNNHQYCNLPKTRGSYCKKHAKLCYTGYTKRS